MAVDFFFIYIKPFYVKTMHHQTREFMEIGSSNTRIEENCNYFRNWYLLTAHQQNMFYVKARFDECFKML